MYYGIVIFSVVLFGIQFFFNQSYQKNSGSGLIQSIAFTFFNNIAGFAILFAINKFRFEFTPFTLLMAALTALNGFMFTFCSLKSFDKINLSLYSLFSMLGGMMLPFVLGILFFDEPLTVGKIVCVVILTGALVLTVKKDNKKKGKSGFIYYAGIFIFNGMSGVITKIFASSSFDKTSDAGYSVLSSIVTLVVSGIILLVYFKKLPKFNARAIWLSFGSGAINRFANYLLLIALAVLPASVQYPMVTGGVMITSTIISYITKQKPSKRELGAVALSFIGILAVTLLP